jgi:hypothetical protein
MQGKMKKQAGKGWKISKNTDFETGIFPAQEIDIIRFYAIMRF